MPLSRQRRQVLTMLVAALVVVVLWWSQAQGEDVPAGGQDSSSSSEPARGADGADVKDDSGSNSTDPDSGLPVVALAGLPSEAARTLGLIDEGGPYPYEEDDGVFGNFEDILPDQQRGYYREYTVETPGLDHRGARRIVAGSGGELYWTDDHYSSFSRIAR